MFLLLMFINYAGGYPSQCDPNYSGACVPIVSYDLDCPSIWETDFIVAGHDKHHFDRDRDCIACESY